MSAISCQTGPERIRLDPLRPDPWALHERNVKARPALREHGRKRPNKAFRLAKSFERIGRTTIPAGRSSARTYHRRRWPAPARLGHREIMPLAVQVLRGLVSSAACNTATTRPPSYTIARDPRPDFLYEMLKPFHTKLGANVWETMGD